MQSHLVNYYGRNCRYYYRSFPSEFDFLQVSSFYFFKGDEPPPPPPGFSLKGISTMLFGAETMEAKQEKLNELGRQVEESEEMVRERQAEVK